MESPLCDDNFLLFTFHFLLLLSPYFDLGQFFVELDDAAVIVCAFVVHFQCLHDLHHRARQRDGDSDFMRGVQGGRPEVRPGKRKYNLTSPF